MPTSSSLLTNPVNRRFSIAPMMDLTDQYCRYFHRLLSRQSVLYTEMVTTGALIYGDRPRHLQFHSAEHPVALQLGGSDPTELATAVNIASSYCYDEINLNCGCPSDRVQSGKFGAILMKDPGLVAQCFQAMQEVSTVPVTIKHRTGIDEQDSYAFLSDFIGTVAEAGCQTFIVHARKAWLKGLSPKQNRDIPPLEYEKVYRLKKDFPQLEIILNGGVTTLNDTKAHLDHVDGVMMGREAYQNPYLLAEVDRELYHDHRLSPDREQILENFAVFMTEELAKGTRLSHMTRHILGLYQGMPGARKFRRYISEHAHRPDAGIEVLYGAMAAMQSTQTHIQLTEPI